MENKDMGVMFTEEDQTQLLRGLLILYGKGIHSREELVLAFDRRGRSVEGIKGIGPERHALIKKALSLGPGRWNKLMDMIDPANPDFFPSGREISVTEGPEDVIALLYTWGDYPGGGAYDLVRSFRASDDLPSAEDVAKDYFQKWISGSDIDPRDVSAHIARLDTATGAISILARWEKLSYDPSMDWVSTPNPQEWGRFLDLPQEGGTHAEWYTAPNPDGSGPGEFVDQVPGTEEVTEGPVAEGEQVGGFYTGPTSRGPWTPIPKELFPEITATPEESVQAGETGDNS